MVGGFSTFIKYQVELLTDNVAGHAEPFYYHPLVLFLDAYPLLFFIAFIIQIEIILFNEENRWIERHKVLFWVVLILFSIVKDKIIHYSSLCWLPLSFWVRRIGTIKYPVNLPNHGY